jgi:hypothetical protein
MIHIIYMERLDIMKKNHQHLDQVRKNNFKS